MNLFSFIFSKIFFKNLLYALVGVLVLTGFFVLWLSFYTSHSNFVEVPDVRGKMPEEVMEQLDDMGLGFEIIDSVYNEGSQGTILEQIPEPGSKVKESRKLFVTVNASHPPMKKVNVRLGESLRIAATKLGILGIAYSTEYRPDICDDCVLAMKYKGKNFESGDLVKKGDKIVLVLGQRGDQKMPVPSLIGASLDTAEQRLARASLAVGYPFFDADVITADDSANARIYRQSPSASAEPFLRIGSPVDVWLSLKPVADTSNVNTEELFE
jgi:beta-lactam-binding protein with PASTA domain